MAPRPAATAVVRYPGLSDGTAAEAGFLPRRLHAALDVLRTLVVDEARVPGAVAVVARHGVAAAEAAYGYAALEPERRALTTQTLFDVASLTKVVATVPVVMALVERARLHLADHVPTLLPGFAQAGKESVTLRHLLTHTSGLAAWVNLGTAAASASSGNPPRPGRPSRRRNPAEGAWNRRERDSLLQRVYEQPLQHAPGTEVVYSDLGFIALGEAAAAAGGAPVDRLARRFVFDPLHMRHTRFRPSPNGGGCIAATERIPDGTVLAGTVHDENARALGGVAGHAGLFSTGRDLAVFCQMLLNGGAYGDTRVLSPASVRAMTRDQTHLPRKLGFGWVLQPNPFFVPCDLCSPAAYSHTGFTGTSLVLDPELDLFVVLLTNRVHPSRENQEIGRVRALFHNAVYAAVE